MSGRLITDRIVNNLLILYIIELTNLLGRLEDTVKLQKLAFLIQKEFVRRKWKGLNYNFFRWHKGPFSADLNADLDVIRHVGLVTKNWPIRLTQEGTELLEDCSELNEKNSEFLKVVDGIVKKFANYTPDEIMNYVYNLQIVVPKKRRKMRIADTLPGTLLLFRMSKNKSTNVFKIDEDWLATLELAFDQEAIESLKQAYSAAIEGKIS